jgi:hypothetical protein
MNPQGATIISICPFPIDEFKPGIIPSNFHIDPAAEGDISILNLGNDIKSRMRVPVVGNVIDMNISPIDMARAIIEDRLTGQLYASPEAKPGLFFVEGTYSKPEAKIQFKKEIADMDLIQKNWFIHLVKIADDDSILEVADKRCVACFSQMHQKATICPICKTNQAEFTAAQNAGKTPVLTAPKG